jgi:hypothetical protein
VRVPAAESPEDRLDHRHAVIGSLVEVVRAATAHERAAVQDVVAVRLREIQAADGPVPARAEHALDGSVNRLLSAIAAYPAIVASPAFSDLRERLAGADDRLAAAPLRLPPLPAEPAAPRPNPRCARPVARRRGQPSGGRQDPLPHRPDGHNWPLDCGNVVLILPRPAHAKRVPERSVRAEKDQVSGVRRMAGRVVVRVRRGA